MTESQANAEIVTPQAEDYAPYHRYRAFEEGFNAYGKHSTRIYDASSVECQAWDRGLDYAYRLHCYALRRRT
jgi:hypothetical protein